MYCGYECPSGLSHLRLLLLLLLLLLLRLLLLSVRQSLDYRQSFGKPVFGFFLFHLTES